jgi:hypothetical protein
MLLLIPKHEEDTDDHGDDQDTDYDAKPKGAQLASALASRRAGKQDFG